MAIAIDGTSTYKGVIETGGANSNAYPIINVKSIPLLAGQLVTIKSFNDAVGAV